MAGHIISVGYVNIISTNPGAAASGYPEICDITGLKSVEKQKIRKNVRKVTFWEKVIQRIQEAEKSRTPMD